MRGGVALYNAFSSNESIASYLRRIILRRVRSPDDVMAVRAGLGDPADWPPTETHPGLNEYDADAMSRNYHGGKPRSKDGDRKEHFRALMKALTAWQHDEVEGDETWGDFTSRIADAMALAARPGPGPVFVSTSGGVIGEIVRQALDAPLPAWIKVHMQVKNAGYSRLIAGKSGLSVASFNETPHLDGTPGMVTYS